MKNPSSNNLKFLFLTSIIFSFQLITHPEGNHTIDFDLSTFSNGFTISTSNPQKNPNSLGIFSPKSIISERNTSEWRLAQWGTRLPIHPSDFKTLNDKTWIAENKCKKIGFYTKENDVPTLTLRCNGIAEFNGRLRKYGEPWSHLLIERKFSPGINVLDSEINFKIRFKITNCSVDQELVSKLDQTLHTAQITAYWTVAEKNQTTGKYNDYFWFGIPLFDYRYPIPPKYLDIDKGSEFTTNKPIYIVDGGIFWKEPTGDGREKFLDVDLSGIIINAIRDLKDRGFFGSSEISNFYITSFNLGWEVTGPFDAEVEITELKFTAKHKEVENEKIKT